MGLIGFGHQSKLMRGWICLGWSARAMPTAASCASSVEGCPRFTHRVLSHDAIPLPPPNRTLRQNLRWQASIFQARSCQRGKPKLDFETRTRTAVGHFNTSSMEAGDRGNEAEAEAVAGSAAASLKPVEPLEDMLTFIGGNSRPVIGDRNDGAALAFFDFHGHSTRVTAMFNGVIDEIGHRVEQEVPVARSEHAPIPAILRCPPLSSAAASKSSTTSLAISTRFTE